MVADAFLGRDSRRLWQKVASSRSCRQQGDRIAGAIATLHSVQSTVLNSCAKVASSQRSMTGECADAAASMVQMPRQATQLPQEERSPLSRAFSPRDVRRSLQSHVTGASMCRLWWLPLIAPPANLLADCTAVQELAD